MERYKIIYLNTATAPSQPIVVETCMSNHYNVAALAPEGLTPLTAIVVDLETGKAASFSVTTIRDARRMYVEAGMPVESRDETE